MDSMKCNTFKIESTTLFLFIGDSKIVSYTKSGQNVSQPTNFTRLLLLQDSKLVLTFNKQSIYIFDAENLQSIEHFHRRFGLFRDVFVDDSNIFVRGSVDTISKFKVSTKTFDEPDFVSTVKNVLIHISIIKFRENNNAEIKNKVIGNKLDPF